jgi:hypothetical protein
MICLMYRAHEIYRHGKPEIWKFAKEVREAAVTIESAAPPGAA